MSYEPLIKKLLSKKRYTHSINVADMCVHLAKQYGENQEKAYMAGILHDIMKEGSPDDIRARTEAWGTAPANRFPPDPIELVAPALWHAPAGGHYAKTELGVTDWDILNAIRFHTIGRADMSLLEKIVYLGDLVSKDREFSDVDKFRCYVKENLDFAMYQALKITITDTLRKNGKIPYYTLDAYNFYNKFNKENKK
ncbi:MAG: bis(5'-nucleosyl)-tetraphosphatase (symmetrical) YqeK [Oscillospiraceae bacterium]|jgi:predicted HD superfamily hydrolase involved in NAD metabolism|nr:bis(5'-nucleosyl)-tetraphosphatase (symmetrical) YqeK [Oscillospiraceae bacterium]